MQIERVPWDSLKPHQRNARMGDVDLIVESVVLNQVYRPIVTAIDGTILCGHHLWYALGELRYPYVDIVRLDLQPDDERALRIMLVDNRSADLGKYDDGLLLNLLQHLAEHDSLPGTGYQTDDVSSLLEKVDDPYTGQEESSQEEKHLLICAGVTHTISHEDCLRLLR